MVLRSEVRVRVNVRIRALDERVRVRTGIMGWGGGEC